MKILITGAAGFVGASLVKYFSLLDNTIELLGIDNLSRKGAALNVSMIQDKCSHFVIGDIAEKEIVESLPPVDWIIDCAANPSVLAGVSAGSRRLLDDNLIGTINLLEKCKLDNSGFIILSTSRVYSINELNNIPLEKNSFSFTISNNKKLPIGFSEKGIAENFSTAIPISLYGVSKLTSELLALEYSSLYGFPLWINRCGVIAGPGQFGKIDQGIFSFWIYQYLLNKSLSFTGFGGQGHQVRDMLHPRDLFELIIKQISNSYDTDKRIFNVGGGINNAISLQELDNFCKRNIQSDKQVISNTESRQFDIPLYITDYSLAQSIFDWKPKLSFEQILESILVFGRENPDFLNKIQ